MAEFEISNWFTAEPIVLNKINSLPLASAIKPSSTILGAVNVLLLKVSVPANEAKSASDTAELNSASVPVIVFVVKEIDLFVNVFVDEIDGITTPSTAKTPADERDNVVSEAWPRSKVDKVVIAPVEPLTTKLVLSTVIPPLAARVPAIVALPFDSKFIFVKLRLVPVAAPIFGVTSVGVFANTNEPVPVSSEIAVANSADVPVKVFVVKLIDLFVNVFVEDAVTTVPSTAIVILSPEIVVSIPVPPSIFNVSEPKVILAVVEVSSEIVKVVEIFCVEALVILPC